MSQFDGPLEDVRVDYADKVCTITLARPETKNALNPSMRRQLWPIFTALRDDSETQVVILTGEGDHFCNGTFDPKSRGEAPKELMVRMIFEGNLMFDDLESLPQITIAALNGPARGAGVELSLACDLRYAGVAATFQQHEATMGGFPGGGAPIRLPTILGYARALEMMCHAAPISAEQAKDYGLVLEVFPDADLLVEVGQRARLMAANGPLALRGAKRIASLRQAPGHADARLLSNRLRHELEFSQDVAEAIAAQKEGRAPVFAGH